MKHTIIFTAILFLLCSFSLHAQTDTRGTDFWLTFGQNFDRTLNEVEFQIRIVASDQAATGAIHFTQIGTSRTFSVVAGGVFTYTLTAAERVAVYNTTMGTSNRSVRITSSAPVTVFALNQSHATTDVTNILPVPALGTEYFHISYQPYVAMNDAYAVIAIENATRIWHNGTLVATLNAGQVYYQTSNADMTGAHVTADKPVAFFMMNSGTEIPTPTEGVVGREAQFQQLPPVDTWGKNFFVPVTSRGVERVRIMASQNGTNITQTGATLPTPVPAGSQNRLTNLNAGEWVELEIRIAQRGAFIQANKPVGVCAYMVSFRFPGLIGESDPSTVWIPAVEQMIPSATIAPFIPTLGISDIRRHYALIVVSTDAKNQTTMAIGTNAPTPLSGGTWYDNATAGFSYYILRLANNANTVYTFANLQGLLVMGYGIGHWESYYYVAGFSFRTPDLTPTITISETTVCQNDSIHLVFTGVPPFCLDYTFNGTRQTITVHGMDTMLEATQAGGNPFIVHSLIPETTCFFDGAISVEINDVVWATRNLASHDTFVNNPEDYGALFQWGRVGDGHEQRNSSTTTTLSTSDNPGHGNFITMMSQPFDWRNPKNNVLWNAGTETAPIKTVNDPCPQGWRVPTRLELARLINSSSVWATVNGINGRWFGTAPNAIFLPAGGYRSGFGTFFDVGVRGLYWSSMAEAYWSDTAGGIVETPNAHSIFFSNIHVGPAHHAGDRAGGRSVRCVRYASNNDTIIPITVHLVHSETVDLTIGENKLPFTWRDTTFLVGTVSREYIFNRQTIHGCSSVVRLNLTVLPMLSAEILNQPVIVCRNETDFTLFYVVLSSGHPQYQSVFFDEKALNFGFENIPKEQITAHSVNIPLPVGGVRPDTYRGWLVLEREFYVEKRLDFEVSVRYDSTIIIQMWNDVLALSNVYLETGSRLFDFQWFINGVLISGETASYLYKSLDFTAEYKARFIRRNETEYVYTCPIRPIFLADKIPFPMLPTLVNVNQTFNISIPVSGYVEIHDLNGRRISRQAVGEGTNSLVAPKLIGTYLMTIFGKTGESIVIHRIIAK